MKCLFTLILCFGAVFSANAQKITLLKEIASQSKSSNPIFFPTFPNGHTLMMIESGNGDFMLYETKGTAATTNIFYNKGSDQYNSLYVNGVLYYIVENANEGKELWKTNGYSGTTGLVKDIYPGPNDGLPTGSKNNMAYYNGYVYFAGTDAATGTELWRTDGTEAGTTRFVNLNSNGSGDPSGFIVAGGKLFFIATNGTDGYELWVSDGTEAGTQMVADLYPGSNDGVDATPMGVYGTNVYFRGRGGSSTGWELYSSDGNNVTLVKNIHTGNGGSSFPLNFFENEMGTMLYFTATNGNDGRELWVTDGTTSGTYMVKDINGNGSSNPSFLGEIKGKLIFSAYEPSLGVELWSSDGTIGGTQLIKDIYPGTGSGKQPLVSEYFGNISLANTNNKYNNIIYFAGDDATNGIELWRTDGTDTGTYMVEDVGNKPTNAASSNLSYLMVDSNNVFLSMSNGENGNEPYIYQAPIPAPPQNVNGVEVKTITRLFPNPNNGTFKVSLGNEYFRYGYLKVVDMAGRTIYDQSISAGQKNLSLALHDSPAGIYKVQVVLDTRTETHTISVQK